MTNDEEEVYICKGLNVPEPCYAHWMGNGNFKGIINVKHLMKDYKEMDTERAVADFRERIDAYSRVYVCANQ